MKPPAFQFYADDFLAGTAEMTAEEVGAYIRLLCHQWTKGGIPNDESRVARMAGLAHGEPNGVAIGSPSLRYVLAKFSQAEDGTLKNARLERVRADQDDYRKNQSTAGKKGAEKRWGNGKPIGGDMATPLATPLAKRCPEDSSPSPSPSPSPVSSTEVQTPNPAPVGPNGASGDLFQPAFDATPPPPPPPPKPAKPAKAAPPREQNETLNALATVGGGVAAEVPKTRWSAVQKCLREIREVCPDVSAEEIRTRARNYRRNNPDWTITPEALTKHWATCGNGQAPAGTPVRTGF